MVENDYHFIMILIQWKGKLQREKVFTLLLVWLILIVLLGGKSIDMGSGDQLHLLYDSNQKHLEVSTPSIILLPFVHTHKRNIMSLQQYRTLFFLPYFFFFFPDFRFLM